MSIRIREVDGYLIAICAARSVGKPGDVYIDDAQHYALMLKFAQDLQGIDPSPDVAALMNREESNNPNRTWWDSVYSEANAVR